MTSLRLVHLKFYLFNYRHGHFEKVDCRTVKCLYFATAEFTEVFHTSRTYQ